LGWLLNTFRTIQIKNISEIRSKNYKLENTFFPGKQIIRNKSLADLPSLPTQH